MAIALVTGGGAPTTGSTMTGASGQTQATATTMNVSAGNLLIAITRVDTLGGVVTGVTDGGSNSFTKAIDIVNGASDHLEIWYKENSASNATATFTVTFTSSGAVYRAIDVFQYSGAKTSGSLDATATGTGTGGTLTSGAFTTAQANELLFVAAQIAAFSTSWTAGSGYTIEKQDASNVSVGQDQIVSTIQSGVTASITNGDTTTAKSIAVATFKDVTAGGGGGAVYPDRNIPRGIARGVWTN